MLDPLFRLTVSSNILSYCEGKSLNHVVQMNDSHVGFVTSKCIIISFVSNYKLAFLIHC